ncbi:MFS general substrate transporter [Mycena kentingensis (nom. inval.)]|nr:MFS general substrate transporter [Mycena kentingensis (nom. inval.)]
MFSATVLRQCRASFFSAALRHPPKLAACPRKLGLLRALSTPPPIPQEIEEKWARHPPSRRLFVGNLPFDATEREIRETFSPFGRILSVFVAVDATNRSRGFGHLLFSDLGEANAAFEAKGLRMLGRELTVQYSAQQFGGRWHDGERPRTSTTSPSRSLYLGRLPADATREDVRAALEPFGEVSRVEVHDPKPGSYEKFGFAICTSQDTADTIFRAEVKVLNHPIIVDYANHGVVRDTPPTTTLYMGNVPFNATREQVSEYLRQFGDIRVIRLSFKEDMFRGFLHVEFKDQKVATEVYELGWFILFGTFGYLYAFGVYENFYALEYLPNHTPSSIAWIGSLQMMMPFLLGVVSGKLFDSGYFHHLEIFGSILFVFSLFMLSLAKPLQYYQIFLTQGLGMGIGTGFVFVPTTSVIAHHFVRRRALATGVLLTGISVGSTVLPIILNRLIPRVGFGPAVRASGYLVLATLVIGNLLVRTGPLARKRAPPDLKAFFTDGAYLFAIVGCLLSTAGIYMPLVYVQLYAIQHSVGSDLAFYSIAIMNGTSALGRIAANYFADKYGPFKLQVACTVATAVMIWTVLGIHNSATLVAVSAFYGVFSGAWLALSIACLASLAATPDEVGARAGIALALGSFGSLGAAPIQGALLTTQYLWVRPVAFSAVSRPSLANMDVNYAVFQTIVLVSAICFAFMTMLVGRRTRV